MKIYIWFLIFVIQIIQNVILISVSTFNIIRRERDTCSLPSSPSWLDVIYVTHINYIIHNQCILFLRRTYYQAIFCMSLGYIYILQRSQVCMSCISQMIQFCKKSKLYNKFSLHVLRNVKIRDIYCKQIFSEGIWR